MQSCLHSWLPREPSYLSEHNPGGPPPPLAFTQFSPWGPLELPSLMMILIVLYYTVYYFIFCTIVSLILLLSKYSHNCISDPSYMYIFQVFWSHIEHPHCKSSINIIQLKTLAYFCLSIGFRRPISLIGARRVRHVRVCGYSFDWFLHSQLYLFLNTIFVSAHF